MKQLNKNYLDRYSRQIILKNIGISGQKKISSSKVFIVGAGGLGSPIADLLCRAGVGEIGIIDHDKVSSIKKAISSGNYPLDLDKISDALMEAYNDMKS